MCSKVCKMACTSSVHKVGALFAQGAHLGVHTLAGLHTLVGAMVCSKVHTKVCSEVCSKVRTFCVLQGVHHGMHLWCAQSWSLVFLGCTPRMHLRQGAHLATHTLAGLHTLVGTMVHSEVPKIGAHQGALQNALQGAHHGVHL